MWVVAPSQRRAQCLDFRVGFPSAVMPTPADNLSALHQHGADHRVGRSGTIGPASQPQRQLHIMAVRGHERADGYSSNKALAYWAGSNGWRSSACSPSPINLIGMASSFWIA